MSFLDTSVKAPVYRVHKPTGQGYVFLNGKRLYLGRDGKAETAQKYHQLVAEYLALGGQLPVEPDQVTIKELIARFWSHAEQYYVRGDGTPAKELDCFRYALRPLKEIYGETKAAEFGPRALQAVRHRMVQIGWCRSYINKQIVRIRTMFRWATEQELIGGNIYHALQAVSGLRRGRGGARETDPVKPVPIQHVYAIKPFVSRQVWALIELQLLTAARPGELLTMRPCDLDTTGKVWTYTPADHKTAHHGHRRTIYLGPQAQEVVRPFLTRSLEAYMFSPKEAEAERRERQHAQRKTPLSCGNGPGKNRKAKPQRTAGEIYDVGAYRHAIVRGCDQAFPAPEPLGQRDDESKKAWQARLTDEQRKELEAWQKAHRWHPHQLRHNAATELRKEFGIEAARVILGHRSPAITEVYAELDHAKAVDAMLRVG